MKLCSALERCDDCDVKVVKKECWFFTHEQFQAAESTEKLSSALKKLKFPT